jgi:hypothetical protein
MDDAEVDRSTPAAPDWLGLVSEVQAFAAANGLTAAEVAKRLLALLSNAPPPDDADEGDAADVTSDTAGLTPRQQTAHPLLDMSRRQREGYRRAAQRRMAEHRASGDPPPDDDRVLAFIIEQRAEIAAVLARTNATPAERAFQAELVLAARWHLAGLSAVEATLWWIDAARRFLMPPGSHLSGLGLFDPIAAVRNALEAAVAGDWAKLRAAMPPRDARGGKPKIPTTARRKASVAAAMAALRMENAVATDAEAAQHVIPLFAAEGIDLGERTPSQYLADLRALERQQSRKQLGARDTYAKDLLELFETLMRDAGRHTAGGASWPLAERLVWARRLAVSAGEMSL